MAQPTALGAGKPSLRASYSCIRCGERKVKCDREKPCSACVKHNVQCIYRPPPLPRATRRRLRDQTIKGRLRRYEAMLKDMGIDPENDTTESSDSRKDQTQPASDLITPNEVLQLATPASTTVELRDPLSNSQSQHGPRGNRYFCH